MSSAFAENVFDVASVFNCLIEPGSKHDMVLVEFFILLTFVFTD